MCILSGVTVGATIGRPTPNEKFAHNYVNEIATSYKNFKQICCFICGRPMVAPTNKPECNCVNNHLALQNTSSVLPLALILESVTTLPQGDNVVNLRKNSCLLPKNYGLFASLGREGDHEVVEGARRVPEF